MPEIIKLAKFSKDLEQRIRSIEGLVLAGEPLSLKLNYIGGLHVSEEYGGQAA
jgi:hypothetical protein